MGADRGRCVCKDLSTADTRALNAQSQSTSKDTRNNLLAPSNSPRNSGSPLLAERERARIWARASSLISSSPSGPSGSRIGVASSRNSSISRARTSLTSSTCWDVGVISSDLLLRPVSKESPKPSVASQQGWDIRRGRLFFLCPALQPANTNFARSPGHKSRPALFFIATESQYLHIDGVPDAVKPINPPPLSLASACCGQKLRVVSLPVSGSECLRLRELGLCERSLVSKLGDGAAILCSFSGVRMAVGRALGAQVLVEAITV